MALHADNVQLHKGKLYLICCEIVPCLPYQTWPETTLGWLSTAL